MSRLVKLFVAPVDVVAALAVRGGPGRALESVSCGNFDPEEAAIEWECQLRRAHGSRRASYCRWPGQRRLCGFCLLGPFGLSLVCRQGAQAQQGGRALVSAARAGGRGPRRGSSRRDSGRSDPPCPCCRMAGKRCLSLGCISHDRCRFRSRGRDRAMHDGPDEIDVDQAAAESLSMAASGFLSRWLGPLMETTSQWWRSRSRTAMARRGTSVPAPGCVEFLDGKAEAALRISFARLSWAFSLHRAVSPARSAVVSRSSRWSWSA